MTTIAPPANRSHTVNAEELFRKLGLRPADEKPIMAGWREACVEWRRQRLRRVAAHTQRVQAHLRRFSRSAISPAPISRAAMGRPRPVWCVELGRHFPTLSAAAAFVDRRPSNISQALKRGVRCGPYHWVEYEEGEHFSDIS